MCFRKYNLSKDIEYQDRILNKFLFFTIIYSVEYKIGSYTKEELNSLANVGSYSFFKFALNDFSHRKQTEPIENKPYWELFGEKYSSIIDSFDYYQVIADYIHEGYLNESNLNILTSEMILDMKKNEGTEEEKLIIELKNWWELSDDALEPLIDKIMTKIDEGRFSLYAYPVIYSQFIKLEYFKVNDFKLSDEITERFKKGIDVSKKSHKYVEAFRLQIPIWNDTETSDAKDKYNEINSYTIKANEFPINKILEEIKTTIILSIINNNSKELEDVISNSAHYGSPIFEKLDEKEIFKLLINANTKTIISFNWGLYGRYPEHSINIFPSFLKEKIFFWELQKLVEKHIAETIPVKISTVQFIELNKNLMRIKKLKI